MKLTTAWFALPSTLLVAIATNARETPWPQHLPRAQGHSPEDEALMRRESVAQQRLAWHAPKAVKKMDEFDEGEKFFLDYWKFEDDANEDDGASRRLDDAWYGNASMIPSLFPAIARHMCSKESRSWHLKKRDFQCPQDTYSCSSIGYSDLCCNRGETCVETQDGIGCCPRGANCGQDVSGCESGYTSCPNSPNGGCCIPGAKCEGTGCVLLGTQTVVRTLETSTETTGASFTTETASGRTVTVAVPTTEISISIQTVTISPSGDTSTQTVTIGSTCRSGYVSCSDAGSTGCCAVLKTTTTATAGEPVLATSQTVTVQDFSSSTAPAGCPTGYYMCSAVYLGGCCRVGRDCHTTSCPAHDTATIVSTAPTIFVTGGGSSAATGGSCANGWFNCGADGNGGCCPSGYSCGVQSCSATNQGERNTAKMAPESAANLHRWGWTFFGVSLLVAVGMIWL